VIFKSILIAQAYKYDTLSEKSQKEEEYLDESYDKDVQTEEQVEEG